MTLTEFAQLQWGASCRSPHSILITRELVDALLSYIRKTTQFDSTGVASFPKVRVVLVGSSAPRLSWFLQCLDQVSYQYSQIF